MKNLIILSLCVFPVFLACSQKLVVPMSDSKSEKKMESLTNLPYHQIPDYPEGYSAHNVVARMIDGLGYRYYWATDGLKPADLAFKPSEDARPAIETLDHIYGLVEVVHNSVTGQPNIRPLPENDWTFEEKRTKTLMLIKEASDLLKSEKAPAMDDMNIVFKRGEKESSFSFWHQLNGPLADALWHTGQVVMMRRSSGNPLPPGVNVFMGKTRSK